MGWSRFLVLIASNATFFVLVLICINFNRKNNLNKFKEIDYELKDIKIRLSSIENKNYLQDIRMRLHILENKKNSTIGDL